MSQVIGIICGVEMGGGVPVFITLFRTWEHLWSYDLRGYVVIIIIIITADDHEINNKMEY